MDERTTWPESPFTRAEMGAHGIDEAALRRALRSGHLKPVVRGVYVAAAVPDTTELRVRALALVIGRHHVITDRTAAWLHGIDAFTFAEGGGVPPIETCALRGHEPTTRSGAAARSRDLLPEDVMRLGDVLVTTPLRTAVDLACCLRRREAFAVLCDFAVRYGLTVRDYVDLLGRYRRRRGVVQARSLAPLVDPRIESQREAWVFLEISDAGLELPEPQVWIEIDGVPTYRLDFAYRRRRVCVEYDGVDAHERTEEQRAHDRARRRWLRDHGWTVIIIRNGDFSGEALERWLDELGAALEPSYTNRRW